MKAKPPEFSATRFAPLIAKRRWDECRALCDAAEAGGTRHFEFFILRATLRLLAKDPAGGWADLERAFTMNPSYAATYAEGEDVEARSRAAFPLPGLPMRELKAELDGTLAREPGRATTWAWRGLVRRRLFDYAAAAADLTKALERGFATALVYTTRGEARLQSGDRGGLADLEKAVTLPCAAWNHAWLGRARTAFFRDKRALGDISRAIRLEPGNDWHWAWRAEAKRILGVRRGRLADYAKALALDAERHHDGFIHTWRGLSLLADGDYDAARRDFEAALRSMPKYALAVNGKARALRGRRRFGDWLRWLDKAVALDQKHAYNQQNMKPELARALAEDCARAPRSARARRWEGFYLAMAGDHAAAEPRFAEALALDPRDAWAWAWRGQFRAERNDPRAAKDLKKALSLDGKLIGARVWLAKLEVAAGRPRAALRHLDAALAADSRFVWAFADRGRLKLMLGDPEGAVRDLRVAVTMNATFAEGWADLAEALRRAGDARGARQAEEASRRLEPGLFANRAAQWRGYFAQRRRLEAA